MAPAAKRKTGIHTLDDLKSSPEKKLKSAEDKPAKIAGGRTLKELAADELVGNKAMDNLSRDYTSITDDDDSDDSNDDDIISESELADVVEAGRESPDGEGVDAAEHRALVEQGSVASRHRGLQRTLRMANRVEADNQFVAGMTDEQLDPFVVRNLGEGRYDLVKLREDEKAAPNDVLGLEQIITKDGPTGSLYCRKSLLVFKPTKRGHYKTQKLSAKEADELENAVV